MSSDSPEKNAWDQVFERASNLFEAKSKSVLSSPNVQLALAIMLVDMALIDSEYHDQEYQAIYNILKDKIELETPDVHQLMSEAKEIISDERDDLNSFGVFLGRRFKNDEKQELMKVFTEVMAADSVIHPFEVDLKGHFERLLDLK